MAIAFDAANSARNSAKNTTSPTLNHTCASGAVLVVFVALDNTTTDPSGVTYNGVSMVKRASTSSLGSFSITIWTMDNPTTGSSQSVVVSWANNSACEVASLSFTGCNNASFNGATAINSGTGTALTCPITTGNDNSWVIDGAYLNGGVGDTLTVNGANQTQRFTQLAFSGEDTLFNGGSQTTTTAGSYTPGWTANNSRLWHQAAIEIKAVSTTAFTRTLSDSIMNGASRSATVGRVKGIVRSISDSIMNGASRSATVGRVVSYIRSVSVSIMNAVSRLVTLFFTPQPLNGMANMRSSENNNPIALDDVSNNSMKSSENNNPLSMDDRNIL